MSLLNLYATRPAPAGRPEARGTVCVIPTGGHTEHTLLGVYNFAVLALDALWLAHEKRASFADGRGWWAPVRGLGHALYRRTPFGRRQAELVARITDDTLTISQHLVDELPVGGLRRARAEFAATYRMITSNPPTRTPQLITVITPGGPLAAEGE